MSWFDTLKMHCGGDTEKIDEDPDEMTDLKSQILREIEKEGGALGMKNLKQFADEKKLKEVLSSMEKDGELFMHEDGDIYTHKPK
tara:strand:- start:189 stop:443 length:255 start_codon:yes stop_codon:yes gene_type:complete